MAAGQSRVHQVWTDEAGAAQHQDAHRLLREGERFGQQAGCQRRRATCKTCRRVLMGWSVASAVGRG